MQHRLITTAVHGTLALAAVGLAWLALFELIVWSWQVR